MCHTLVSTCFVSLGDRGSLLPGCHALLLLPPLDKFSYTFISCQDQVHKSIQQHRSAGQGSFLRLAHPEWAAQDTGTRGSIVLPAMPAVV